MASPSQTRRFFRPTWAEVDLGRLQNNLRKLRRLMPRGVRLMFVMKANAYGHGAVSCAKAAGPLADWLGVSSVEEGVALREAGVRLPVLILGSLYPFESFLAAAEYRLTPTVASLEAARRLAEASSRLGRPLSGHLKIDTGMGRIGMSPEGLVPISEFLEQERRVRMEGVYTHFARADSDPAFTRKQLALFKKAAAFLEQRLKSALLRHAANSTALLRCPASRLDLVRPGLAVYGLIPGFDPILTLKSRIVFLKTVLRGVPVSYDSTFRAKRRSRIATVPLGYADGLSRRLSNRGWALVGGRRCPIIGRVTMDMTMLDVTDVPEGRVGDEAIFIGRQGEEEISVLEIARTLGTIPYEVVCAISPRVPRVYTGA